LSAASILGVAVALSLIARLLYPEILPVLDVMRIIFYLILAVTIIAVLRNVVGIITYGVFGPAIISLGLTRIGDLFWGLIIFFSIAGVAILVRFVLEPLKLQMTHRLATVVVAVASTMGILIFVGESPQYSLLMLAEFLPILITSWIAERFVRDSYESGIKQSLTRLAYTLVAVLVSYVLIREPSIVTFFIFTPELWVVPVALNILIGASVRVRLSERLRFRKLVKSSPDGKGFSQVLTVNLRNRNYLEQYNPMRLHPNISKLGVKESLQKAGIPVPRTLATIERFSDLKNLDRILHGMPNENGFVIKPNNSFGGRGIQVFKHADGHLYEKTDGTALTYAEISENAEAALDGEYSGRWLPDKILIEELIVAHPDLAKLSCFGLPDIRVIVFRGIPVMAMTRLPTKESGGKANLHQGAVGAGIDLLDGKITNAVVAHEKNSIVNHPDTGVKLIGETVPFWDEILRLAVRSQQATGLGYVGVDIVIDVKKGPLVMEVNKRPGLEIQNANRKPLLKRLRAVEYLLADKAQASTEEGSELMRFLESRNWQLSTDDKRIWEKKQ